MNGQGELALIKSEKGESEAKQAESEAADLGQATEAMETSTRDERIRSKQFHSVTDRLEANIRQCAMDEIIGGRMLCTHENGKIKYRTCNLRRQESVRGRK